MKAHALVPALALAAALLAPPLAEAGHRHGPGCGHRSPAHGYYYGYGYRAPAPYYRSPRHYYAPPAPYYGYGGYGYGGYGYGGYAYGYGGYGYYPPPPPRRYHRPRPRVGFWFSF